MATTWRRAEGIGSAPRAAVRRPSRASAGSAPGPSPPRTGAPASRPGHARFGDAAHAARSSPRPFGLDRSSGAHERARRRTAAPKREEGGLAKAALGSSGEAGRRIRQRSSAPRRASSSMPSARASACRTRFCSATPRRHGCSRAAGSGRVSGRRWRLRANAERVRWRRPSPLRQVPLRSAPRGRQRALSSPNGVDPAITGEPPEERDARAPSVEPVGSARHSRQRSGRGLRPAASEVVPRGRQRPCPRPRARRTRSPETPRRP